MRSSYTVAASVLVGLSTSLVVSRDPAHNSSITITPHATPTQASSGPSLSQRQVTGIIPPIASDIIDLPEKIISIIFGPSGKETTFITMTTTYTGDPEPTTGPFTVTATVTEEPDPTTHSVVVTATVTEEPDPTTHSVTLTEITTASGSFTTITHTVLPPVTVTTTASQSIVTTTQFTSPVPTDTTAPAPAPAPAPSGGPGCYFPLPDGQLTVAPCGPGPVEYVLPSSAV